jgi:hypothetical protein
MSDSGVANHVEAVLNHRLADLINVQFGGFHSNRLQPQRVHRLKCCEFKLLGAKWKEQRKLGIADQARIEQSSVRHSKLCQRFLERRVVPKGDANRFLFAHAIIKRHTRGKKSFTCFGLIAESRSEPACELLRNSVPRASQLFRVAA